MILLARPLDTAHPVRILLFMDAPHPPRLGTQGLETKMSKRELHIGYDNTLAAEVDDGRLSGNDVYVVAHNGRVTIAGPFLDWEGFKVLAEFEDTDAGERLAEKIARNPVAELVTLGYDTTDWFVPLNA